MSSILIVDDSELPRKKLREILEKEGHTIVGEAVNGNIGFEKFKELKPDIVFMDIEMPECDGIDAVGLIIDYNPLAKIIMGTTLGGLNKIMEALNQGAKGYVNKPYNPLHVIKAIDKVMKS